MPKVAPVVQEKAKFDFKVVKNLTLPLIKLAEDVPEYVKITAPYFVGKEVKGTGTAAKMEPAILANVINLQTGEESQIILNTIVKSNFDEEYEGNTYVGKCFALTKHAKREGKKYNDFSIQEIEV